MFTHVKTCLKKILLLSLVVSPTAALAWGGDDPVAKGLGWFVNIILGQTGIYLATLAVIGTGVACLFRLVQWVAFIWVVGGVAVIFGSMSIVTGIKSVVS